jgi:hypothetical protein
MINGGAETSSLVDTSKNTLTGSINARYDENNTRPIQTPNIDTN